MTIQTDQTISSISIEYPQAVKVFMRHNIDFCCGGDRTLSSVCEADHLDVHIILDEIEQVVVDSDPLEIRWDQESITDLIDHILTVYHEPLWEELPRLESLAAKVFEVHVDKDPKGLTELLYTFRKLRIELEQHMSKEEQVLFPMVLSGHSAMVGVPISAMLLEHDTAGEVLLRIRALTNNYQLPEEACDTWRALWYGLEQMETDLHKHIHLENNILFPRVLAT
ncbi:iron-sulfur cluster repair di-iron protein [bacterium AH-315-F18]|nr:iron-sulfur cluster repair di-iron protein [bacterium AH-315-F18]